jgi:hypothetical protein
MRNPRTWQMLIATAPVSVKTSRETIDTVRIDQVVQIVDPAEHPIWTVPEDSYLVSYDDPEGKYGLGLIRKADLRNFSKF